MPGACAGLAGTPVPAGDGCHGHDRPQLAEVLGAAGGAFQLTFLVPRARLAADGAHATIQYLAGARFGCKFSDTLPDAFRCSAGYELSLWCKACL